MGGGEEAGALLNRAATMGLIGKVGFEQRLEGGEGIAKGKLQGWREHRTLPLPPNLPSPYPF